MRKFCLLLPAVCVLSQSYAQDIAEQDLEDVIVLSERINIPFSKQNRNIQIITAEQIRQIPVNSLNELLSFVAGVDVRQRGPNGSQADVGIDGGTFDQTLLLLNGFKMSDVQTGHNMMNIPVPLDAIERIEVLKGAAARAYGVNALMGVINIVTKKGSENGLSVSAHAGSSFMKDEDTKKYYTNWGAQTVAQLQSGNTAHLLAGALDKGNGYRYNTAYENKRLFYSTQANLSAKARLEAMAGIAQNQFGANAFYAAPNDKESEEEVNNYHIAFRVPIYINRSWTIKPSAVYRNGYDHYVFVRQNPSVYENKHRTHTLDASIDNVINTRAGTLAIGANIRRESINSSNLGEHLRLNYGLSTEFQSRLLRKLDIVAGVYWNYNSIYGFNIYPGLDLGYALSQHVRLYGNVGLGQRLPTFTDLYYEGPNNLGNDQLTPEAMISYELGVKMRKNGSYINASLFYKDGREFIDWIRPDSLSAWMVNNFTSLQTLGVHLDAGYTHFWSKGSVTLHTGYTYLNPKIGAIRDENKSHWQSQYAVNALRHQWTTRIAFNIDNGWGFSLGNRLVERHTAHDSYNGYAQRHYMLTDAQMSYRHGAWSTRLMITNLFDIKYIESGVVPLPGRWFTLGATLQL